jgi:hypothetical protein
MLAIGDAKMSTKIVGLMLFIASSVFLSFLLYPVRHPFFSGVGFNIVAIGLETLIYVFLIWKRHLKVSAVLVGVLSASGILVSFFAYFLVSVFLDKYGLVGLQKSTSNSGIGMYLSNSIFASFFSYCWLQFPASVALQAYLSALMSSRRT